MGAVAVALAVFAALANAAASVLQRRAGQDEPDERAFSPSLVLHLVRRPVWLFGILAILVGFATQAVALTLGGVAVVQPVLVVELPLTFLLAALVFRFRPRWSEARAVAGIALGLVAFLYCLAPGGGDPSRTSAATWAIGTALTVALGVAAYLLGRAAREHRRAALLGVATGIGFGLTAVLTAAAGSAAGHGFGHLVAAWQTWALLVVGPVSFFVLQSALQAGSLIASQPALTLSNPAVAVTWGLAVFGEHTRHGFWLVGAVAGVVLIAAGTVLLARSPLLSDAGQRG